MMIFDENGECLDTANNLRARFEALQMQTTAKDGGKDADKFRVKRFKVRIISRFLHHSRLYILHTTSKCAGHWLWRSW